MSLLVILLRAILHPPWEMRRKAHLGCTNAPSVPVAGIAKSRRFGRLAAPIQAKLSRPTIGAALDLPFDKATSTSASVSPTTDVGATSLRDVVEPEAVVRAAQVLVRGRGVDGERARWDGAAGDGREKRRRSEGEGVGHVGLARRDRHAVQGDPGGIRPGEHERLAGHGAIELQL